MDGTLCSRVSTESAKILAFTRARGYIQQSQPRLRACWAARARNTQRWMRGGNVSVNLQDSAVAIPSRESIEPRVWRNSAACRDTDPDLFFPVGQTGPAIAHIANAKQVCTTCAVKRECLEYALMTNQDAGIWGGLTEDERRQIRRERRRANRA